MFFVVLLCFSFSSLLDQSAAENEKYNILGIFPYPARSHYAVFDPLMVELAKRGHNVTIYDTFPKETSIPNYHEISIKSCFSLPNILGVDQMNELTSDEFQTLSALSEFLPSREEIFNCKPLQKLLTEEAGNFDVFITETFHMDFFLMYGARLKTPIITFHSNTPLPWHSERMGLPDNPSYLPFAYSMDPIDMGFWSRMKNAALKMYALIIYRLYSENVFSELAAEYFTVDRSALNEAVNNISLLFLYSHFTLSPSSRPLTPNVIEVAGLNIKQPRELPENIEKFINESKHGVVYFCMGSLLRGETFPPEKREAFLYAFSKIPQRVLWKWEGDVLPGKSDNIMISKWMPQRDILAHPNVKLFISHGGLLGTSEAVYEGVPVLGIPIFGDQRTNIKSLEANGAGELLDYNEISKEVVLEKIQRLLNDPKYKENAKLLSDRYRDRPMSPLDTAVYWTEYVIRHKGAPHLRTAAADMPWYQYLLLDVIAFIVAVLVAGLLIIYYTTKFILRAIYGLICGGGAKKGSSKSDKKKRN
ncbi:UDP-glycosyltransferase UGT5-like isoform X9 [Planococcus citri]|uniref:UDP-glycosyltransferase UGT5-like isoform X9 n=1 Tax=Planococcus citri TaxID=170843 RepID=UPI0031F75CAF